ncbi:MAG: lysophospholipid acyltransferase family protein [Candidatus Binatia bacterium]
MRLLKFAAFLSLWVVFFVLVAIVHLWISILGLPNRWKILSRLNRNYTLLLRLILNIKVTIAGDEGQLERGGYVVIANHVSYVDGIVLGSIFPIVFVSKREVKKWPIVGQWNVLCGTIFINRQRKNEAGTMVREMTRKLRQEANVLLFPEGTSTNGEKMLPFQTVPLAAPLRSRSIILPVNLAYQTIDEQPVTAATRDFVYWYGDMDFVTHFWNLLGRRGVEVLVTLHPKIECFRYADNSAGRKKLAEDCYNRVLGRVRGKDLFLEDGGDNTDEPSTLLSS